MESVAIFLLFAFHSITIYFVHNSGVYDDSLKL